MEANIILANILLMAAQAAPGAATSTTAPTAANSPPWWLSLLASSLLATVVTLAVTAGKEAWNRRRDRKFAALYIALTLEKYGEDASDRLSDIVTSEASNGAAGRGWGNIPEFPEFPKDIDWKAFGIEPTTSALDFATEVRMTSKHIDGLWDVAGDDEAIPLIKMSLAKLGIKAFESAAEFRMARRIKPARYDFDPTPLEFLRAERQRLDEIERREREARVRMNAELIDQASGTEAEDKD